MKQLQKKSQFPRLMIRDDLRKSKDTDYLIAKYYDLQEENKRLRQGALQESRLGNTTADVNAMSLTTLIFTV